MQFEENGVLGDALNADQPIFPYHIDQGGHGEIVRIALPGEIVGYVMLVSEAEIDALDQISLRLCALHASHFAYMLQHARLIRRFERQQELLEQKVAARTRRIEQSKREITTILNSLKTGVLVIDPLSHEIEEANEFASLLIGSNNSSLCGRPWRNIFSPVSHSELSMSHTPASLVNAEYVLQNSDGWHIPVLLTLTPVRIGGRDRLLCSFIDITDRKQAEEALRRSKEKTDVLNRELEAENHRANQMALEAEAANVAKSAFLANIGHELRTPMNAILGFTGLVLQSDLAADQREYLEIVRERGNALLKLIENILDYSRIEAAKLEMTASPFSLREIISEVVEKQQHHAHEKYLNFEWSIDSGVPDALRGDYLRLQQILNNLLGNAVKFTQEGGISMEVRRLDPDLELPEPPEADRPHPPWTPPQDCAEIVLHFIITDTGIGIHTDKHLNIFKPFTQADESSTRRYGGAGLGLATSKRLIELQGGCIWVNSMPHKGSTFQFTIKFGMPHHI
jgi:PAS domain S-box-containing protein